MTYQKYLTGLKLQYAAGLLSKPQVKAIPRSTRHSWRKLTVQHYWVPGQGLGSHDTERPDLAQALLEIQRLKKLLRTVAYLIVLQKMLLKLFVIKREHYQVVKPFVNACLKRLDQTPNGNRLKRQLPFTSHQMSAWNSRRICRLSLVSLCSTQHPQQFTRAEAGIIKTQATDPQLQNWPLISRYYQLLRLGLVHCSRSSFYKYCRLLHITHPKKRVKVAYEPLRAAKALELLHMDVTIDKQVVPDSKTYLHVIRR